MGFLRQAASRKIDKLQREPITRLNFPQPRYLICGGVAPRRPRVTIPGKRTALAKDRLGRSELKPFTKWNDGGPETELNFKFYRQATNKIVGISDVAAAFLNGFF